MIKNNGPRTYFGIVIFKQSRIGGLTGSRLAYYAFTPQGQVAADTLAEIKEAIRDAVKCPASR